MHSQQAPGHQGAQREPHQVHWLSARQLGPDCRQDVRHGVRVAAVRRQIRIAIPRQIHCQHAMAGVNQRQDIEQPMGPGAAGTMQQQHRRTGSLCPPDMAGQHTRVTADIQALPLSQAVSHLRRQTVGKCWSGHQLEFTGFDHASD